MTDLLTRVKQLAAQGVTFTIVNSRYSWSEPQDSMRFRVELKSMGMTEGVSVALEQTGDLEKALTIVLDRYDALMQTKALPELAPKVIEAGLPLEDTF